jgi:hypothetical protein
MRSFWSFAIVYNQKTCSINFFIVNFDLYLRNASALSSTKAKGNAIGRKKENRCMMLSKQMKGIPDSLSCNTDPITPSFDSINTTKETEFEITY